MPNENFVPELNVGRINIVDNDGKLRMLIASKDSFPTEIPIGNGRTVHHERGATGILFFNDDGAECGGLIWGGTVDGRNAGMSLTFDQVDQDQVVGLQYTEENGRRTYGLHIWDRPDDQSLAELIEASQKVRAMPEGPEKQAAWRQFGVGHSERLFVGKTIGGDTTVALSDSNGQTRLRLSIGDDNEPRIEFLDTEGKVVRVIGADVASDR